MADNVTELLIQIMNLAQDFLKYSYEFATRLIWWYVTPLEKIVEYYDPLNISGLIVVISGSAFRFIKDYSLLQLTLGVGIGFYLIYQFITWLLNIVT